MTYPRPGECIRFHCLEMADQRADKMGWKLGSGVLDVYLFSMVSFCKNLSHTSQEHIKKEHKSPTLPSSPSTTSAPSNFPLYTSPGSPTPPPLKVMKTSKSRDLLPARRLPLMPPSMACLVAEMAGHMAVAVMMPNTICPLRFSF